MGKFHIKANGEPGPCVAKPGNCRFAEDDDHHYTKEAARVAYERANAKDTIETYSRSHVADSELSPEGLAKRARVTQALTSDLNYTGPSPKWLSELHKNSEKLWGPGNEPKIVDVIDSPEGELAVVWTPMSGNNNDTNVIRERGFIIREISFVNMETGERQGYLKASFVDDESCKKSWGDDKFAGIRYMDEYDGHNFGIKEYINTKADPKVSEEDRFKKVDILETAKTPEEVLVAKKKIWAASYRALGLPVNDKLGEYVPSYNVNEEHAPETEAEIDNAMKPVHKATDRKLDDFKKDFRTPFVDFSSVSSSLKGQGYGGALYVYTARMLAKENRILRGSGLQSDSAKGAWEGLSKDKRLPVKKLTQHWSKSPTSVVPILDFRKNKTAI